MMDSASKILKLLIDLAYALCVKAGAYPKAVSNPIIYTCSSFKSITMNIPPMVLDVIQDPLVS
jgi:hypothetical protein